MAKFRAVFSDIDGTLLNTEHEIPYQTKRKIRQLTENSIPFVLVSARMPKGMAGIRDELRIRVPMVCYSGALVKDRDGAILFSRSLDARMAEDIFSDVQKEGLQVSFNLYSNDSWFIGDEKDPWADQESRITGVIPEVKDFTKPDTFCAVHKILCMGAPEEILLLETMLKKRFPGLAVYRSKDSYLEIMSGLASKSGAIKLLEEHFGISRQEIIAFGDGHNDMDMLSYAGMGVAMGNAPVEVKQAADMVTASNDEEGLKEVLDLYF